MIRSPIRHIIPALNSRGYSNVDLSVLCSCSPSTIANWANGVNEPRDSQAILLRDLAASETQKIG